MPCRQVPPVVLRRTAPSDSWPIPAAAQALRAVAAELQVWVARQAVGETCQLTGGHLLAEATAIETIDFVDAASTAAPSVPAGGGGGGGDGGAIALGAAIAAMLVLSVAAAAVTLRGAGKRQEPRRVAPAARGSGQLVLPLAGGSRSGFNCDRSELTLGEQLGAGAFGTVLVGVLRRTRARRGTHAATFASATPRGPQLVREQGGQAMLPLEEEVAQGEQTKLPLKEEEGEGGERERETSLLCFARVGMDGGGQLKWRK